MRKNLGFTLVELLITIAIIAVLSSIGIVAYSTVLKQGRDSKRQSDLRAIQSALEQSNSDQGFYPPLRTDACPTGGGRFNPNPECSFYIGTKTYLNIIPKDPDPGTTYQYIPFDNPGGNTDDAYGKVCGSSTEGRGCNSYCLFAKLESLSSPNIPTVCSSYNPDSSKYNFALTPP